MQVKRYFCRVVFSDSRDRTLVRHFHSVWNWYVDLNLNGFIHSHSIHNIFDLSNFLETRNRSYWEI